ncbi:hypothetical protein BTK96_006420 [Burkholderia pyrrocinia]|uniref:hypothetical protein n=1 Tax=Burkholderia sp. IT-111MI5 TaxID=3026439 RepID=UPI002A2A9703|nr:hypothetical protein [Burkholderia pyrrocinia]EKS9897761.1 hypothetical protein [Burkholderia pyrrocinia]EKS9910812.1 hypothetical protein [Burkholderia pyrrocinia]
MALWPGGNLSPGDLIQMVELIENNPAFIRHGFLSRIEDMSTLHVDPVSFYPNANEEKRHRYPLPRRRSLTCGHWPLPDTAPPSL